MSYISYVATFCLVINLSLQGTQANVLHKFKVHECADGKFLWGTYHDDAYPALDAMDDEERAEHRKQLALEFAMYELLSAAHLNPEADACKRAHKALKNGAPINTKDDCDSEDTALIRAARRGFDQLVEVLLSHNPDIHHKNIHKKSAIEEAVAAYIHLARHTVEPSASYAYILERLASLGATVDDPELRDAVHLWPTLRHAYSEGQKTYRKIQAKIAQDTLHRRNLQSEYFIKDLWDIIIDYGELSPQDYLELVALKNGNKAQEKKSDAK